LISALASRRLGTDVAPGGLANVQAAGLHRFRGLISLSNLRLARPMGSGRILCLPKATVSASMGVQEYSVREMATSVFRKSYSKGRPARLQLKALALSLPLPSWLANRGKSLPATMRKCAEPRVVACVRAGAFRLRHSQGVAGVDGFRNGFAWVRSAPIVSLVGSFS